MPTVPELKKLCKDSGIKGYSKLNKANLLSILGKSPAPRSPSKKSPKKSPKKVSKFKRQSPVKRVYNVIFAIKYRRDTDSSEADPTASELERYVAKSTVIPDNPKFFSEFKITKPVTYIGKLRFKFTCESEWSPKEIVDSILNQSLADGEWEASPGKGSFVYPTNRGEQLGLLSFKYVKVTERS